ncbi:hypothetical protein MKX01_012216, partial [Papaver californicum]
VINAVRPDAVALELCKQRALLFGMWRNPEKVGLVRMFLRCMRSSGGFKSKIDTFFSVRRLQASLMRVSELKVAMEESQKVKARIVLIDQDIDHRVIFIERDILMFTKLRRLEEKLIVAVVGLGHMDGIELLWKYAEDVGDD